MPRNMRSDLLAAACAPWTQQDDGSLRQEFRLDETFIGFAGHFPGYPVVPAVAQMLAAQLVIEQQQRTPLRLHCVSHAKFLKQLPPQRLFRVECRCKSEQPLCYDAKVMFDETVAATFRLTFARQEKHDG